MSSPAPSGTAPLPRHGLVRLIIIEPEGASHGLHDLAQRAGGHGFRIVHEFPSVAAAVSVLERDVADLALVDVGGRDELSALAMQPAFGRYLPFVVVDDAEHADKRLRALEIGAQDYFAKAALTPEVLAQAMRWSAERGRRLRALQVDNDLFLALLESVPDRIYFKDRKSRFLRVSNSVSKAHGIEDPALLIGKSDYDIYPAEQAEETFKDEQRVMETGEPLVSRIARRVLPDGTDMWVSSTKLPLRDRRRRVVGCFGITRDLTPVKKLEIALAEERNLLSAANEELSATVERLRVAHRNLHDMQLQLIEAEKLESIGRLAAGVAHEVKNPLAIISMGIEFLSSKYPDDETTVAVLKELNDATRRADNVIKGLLDFSAPRQLVLEASDLNAIIRTALRLVRGEVRSGAHQVELELGEIPAVQVDRAKISQVFVNLFTNALQAMPDGGVLTVRTRLQPAVDGDGDEERVVIAEVADTGPGVPPDVLPRIFEPFFTTKPTGKGTGLGMSVVRSIMELQCGAVTIGNRDCGGAVATLTFKTDPSL